MTEDGIPGDLICTRPFPSMPVGFWGDTPDKTAYKAAYFSKFEGVWAHGDFLLINPKTKGTQTFFNLINAFDDCHKESSLKRELYSTSLINFRTFHAWKK